MFGRVVLVLSWSVALLACTPREETALVCPDLHVGDWHWVGVVGPPGATGPFARIELVHEGKTIAAGWASDDGSFAVRGAVRGPLSQDGVRVRSADGHAFGPFHPGPAQAWIAFRSNHRPVYEGEPGTLIFDAELDGAPGAPEITAAWLFSWYTGEVRGIAPTPRLGVPFRAGLPGHEGECASVITRHAGGGTGGCWWPSGGGCVCHHCSTDALAVGCVETVGTATPCVCTPDTDPPPPPGRDPLPVDERHDPPPPPDTPVSISPEPASSYDAGPRPDAGDPPDLSTGEFAADGGAADAAPF